MKRAFFLLCLLAGLHLPANAQSPVWGVTSPPPGESLRSENSSTTLSSSHGAFRSEYPHIFGGGGLSLGFGDVEYYDIQPLIGIQLNPLLSTGVSFLYRYREDKRFATNLSTEDYGATLFGRLHVNPNLFLHGEYEYLDYEYYRADLSKDRDDFSSLLAGAGISQPLSRRGSAYATVLYNFSYDQSNSPYDTAWVYRFGISYGF